MSGDETPIESSNPKTDPAADKTMKETEKADTGQEPAPKKDRSTIHGILFICLMIACVKGYTTYLNNQNQERIINYMEKRESARRDSILKKDRHESLHINYQRNLEDSIH